MCVCACLRAVGRAIVRVCVFVSVHVRMSWCVILRVCVSACARVRVAYQIMCWTVVSAHQLQIKALFAIAAIKPYLVLLSF